MLYLLKYSNFDEAMKSHRFATYTKIYQHAEMERVLPQFAKKEGNVGEVGSKGNFDSLLMHKESRLFIIEPYNGAAGAGLSAIPEIPYPIGLFRCLVGPDSHIIPSDFFDLTFSVSVIEHIGQVVSNFDCSPTDSPPEEQERLRDEFCQEMFRVTKPGGVTIHTVDHAARNLSFVKNFLKAGFELIDPSHSVTVDECLSDPDAVRQKTRFRHKDKPMPLDKQALHSVLLMGFRKAI